MICMKKTYNLQKNVIFNHGYLQKNVIFVIFLQFCSITSLRLIINLINLFILYFFDYAKLLTELWYIQYIILLVGSIILTIFYVLLKMIIKKKIVLFNISSKKD